MGTVHMLHGLRLCLEGQIPHPTLSTCRSILLNKVRKACPIISLVPLDGGLVSDSIRICGESEGIPFHLCKYRSGTTILCARRYLG